MWWMSLLCKELDKSDISYKILKNAVLFLWREQKQIVIPQTQHHLLKSKMGVGFDTRVNGLLQVLVGSVLPPDLSLSQ